MYPRAIPRTIELEGVLEGRDDERVVVCEGAFGEVETDTAGVDDDETSIVFAGLVDDNGG